MRRYGVHANVPPPLDFFHFNEGWRRIYCFFLARYFCDLWLEALIRGGQWGRDSRENFRRAIGQCIGFSCRTCMINMDWPAVSLCDSRAQQCSSADQRCIYMYIYIHTFVYVNTHVCIDVSVSLFDSKTQRHCSADECSIYMYMFMYMYM